MKYFWWLWQHSKGIRWNSAVRIVTGTAQVLLGLTMVWLSRRFIDETIRTGTRDDIIYMIVLLVITVMSGVLLRQMVYLLTTTANIRQVNDMRLRIFSCLFRRQLFTEEELHSGDVTSRMSKDIETVSTVTTDTLPQMAITMIQLSGAFLLMRWFDELLAWALLLLTPMALVFGKLIARKLRQMTLDIRQDESRIQMQVQEGMEYNAVLRSLGSEQWVTDRLDSMQQRLRGNVMKRMRFTVVTRLIIGCAFSLGYLLAFVWGGIGLRNGTITFGVMTSFLQLVGMIQHPILQLLNMVPGIIHCTASIDRLKELEAADDAGHFAGKTGEDNGGTGGGRFAGKTGEDNGGTGGGRFAGKTGEDNGGTGGGRFAGKTGEDNGGSGGEDGVGGPIRFSDVSFRYAKGDRTVLDHFTHEFKPGSKTAIMGETGIGKTTLFRLLLGFIEPTSGEVIRNGVFCFVPQGNTLMSGTIRYNLQLAKPEATDDELQEVLHTACADFVLQLPNGLDTELGERGSGLSEGQSQRIAIARGLLRPGTIMLLDEISSALDETTERELFERLFAKYPDRTFLLITHRTLVAELCNDIIRL